jgi:hypothetical protein
MAKNRGGQCHRGHRCSGRMAPSNAADRSCARWIAGTPLPVSRMGPVSGTGMIAALGKMASPDRPDTVGITGGHQHRQSQKYPYETDDPRA